VANRKRSESQKDVWRKPDKKKRKKDPEVPKKKKNRKKKLRGKIQGEKGEAGRRGFSQKGEGKGRGVCDLGKKKRSRMMNRFDNNERTARRKKAARQREGQGKKAWDCKRVT